MIESQISSGHTTPTGDPQTSIIGVLLLIIFGGLLISVVGIAAGPDSGPTYQLIIVIVGCTAYLGKLLTDILNQLKKNQLKGVEPAK